MEYLECLRFVRGIVARDNKAFINQRSSEAVGVPFFRKGDFFHYEPGWCPRWMKYSKWKDQYPYEDMPAVWMFPGQRSPRLRHEHYNNIGKAFFDGRVLYNDIPVYNSIDNFCRRAHLFNIPEEQLYRVLSYSTDFASMNHSFSDYGKRPVHIPETFGTLAGDLHRSSYIYRFGTSLIGWDRDFVEGYSKDVPLSVLVNSHSVFRRVCFGYGIPLDYRD